MAAAEPENSTHEPAAQLNKHGDAESNQSDSTINSQEDAHTSAEPPAGNFWDGKKHWLRRNGLIILVVLLNLGMGSASAALLIKKPAPPSGEVAASSVTSEKNISSQQNPSSIKDTPDAVLEHYTSQPLNLEFDYPIDWHIDSDTSNKQITISSPATEITDDTGRSVKSRVEILIEPKYDAGQFNLIDDSIIISAPSEPITYTKPAEGQRKTTNISFGRYDSDPAASISSFFISGNLAYSSGQAASSKNYKSINPFIFMYLNSCPNGGCQALSVSHISLDTYHTNPILIKAKEIIQSMRFN